MAAAKIYRFIISHELTYRPLIKTESFFMGMTVDLSQVRSRIANLSALIKIKDKPEIRKAFFAGKLQKAGYNDSIGLEEIFKVEGEAWNWLRK